MCGIAGLIHKNEKGRVGSQMTSMLQSMKHRGPDSTGFAVYGQPSDRELVMRLKVAEREDLDKGFDIRNQIKQRKAEINRRIQELNGQVATEQQATEYAWRYHLQPTPSPSGDLPPLRQRHGSHHGRAEPRPALG